MSLRAISLPHILLPSILLLLLLLLSLLCRRYCPLSLPVPTRYVVLLCCCCYYRARIHILRIRICSFPIETTHPPSRFLLYSCSDPPNSVDIFFHFFLKRLPRRICTTWHRSLIIHNIHLLISRHQRYSCMNYAFQDNRNPSSRCPHSTTPVLYDGSFWHCGSRKSHSIDTVYVTHVGS